MRFCSRCGFLMEGVMHLLANSGILPHVEPGERKISKKRKGVMQGVVIFLAGILIVPLFGTMSAFSDGRISDVFGFFAAMSAIICFVGGLLRTLFAAIFEEGAPKPRPYMAAPSYMPPAMPPAPARVSALPPPAVNTQPWRQRPETAEIVPPSSVPDHTTKLLEKSEENS
jgi:hypothetical protein